MRNTFLSLVCLFFIFGCSTNNGVTTVVPAAPTNLTGASISATQINLSWTDNATNETGYKVQRKSAIANYTDVASTSTDMTNYNDQGLTPNTTYTYRAYAYNSAGNSLQYSNEVSVTTNASSTNLCEVTIGSQIWSCKNLDVSTYRNGDPIPQVTNPTAFTNLTSGAWCYYNNDPALGAIYGKLYNWYAVNDPRGIAPQGWHVPNDNEWQKLIKYLDPNADTTCIGCAQSSVAGGYLKETGITHWQNPNSGASNTTNFTGLPAGSVSGVIPYSFNGIQTSADFWSTSFS